MLATLMLATPQAGVLSVASAEEVTPEEDAILQMEPVKDEDEPMVDPVPDEVLPLVEEATDTEELTSAESEAEGGDAANEYPTPVMDLSTAMIDRNVATAGNSIKLSLSVSNPDSVSWLEVGYCVNGDYDHGYAFSLEYDKSSSRFVAWCGFNSVYGEYEIQHIYLYDTSGDIQMIYNSASTNRENFPGGARTYDLSALNFSIVDDRIYTLDVLKAALSMAIEGDQLLIAGTGDFIIDESITIPQGVCLNVQSGRTHFIIAKNTTFTTNGQFNCDAPMNIEGRWENNGDAFLRGLYVASTGKVENSDSIYCQGGLSIAAGGHVENNSYLRFSDSYENNGTLITASSASTWMVAEVYDFFGLKTALSSENPGKLDIHLYVTDLLTLTEDISIPENTQLYVHAQNADATLLVGVGTTLTTNSDFSCYIPMTVAGTWINRCYGARLQSGLTITTTGKVDSSAGWIDLYGELVNNGVITDNSSMNRTSIATSMDELTALLEKHSPDKELQIQLRGNYESFIVDKNLTIPKGVYVSIQHSVGTFKIAKDVLFVTKERLTCDAPIRVDGTWENTGKSSWGHIDATISADGTVRNLSQLYFDTLQINGYFNNSGSLSVSNNLLLASTGSIDNSGTIYVNGNYTFDGKLTQTASGHIYYRYPVQTFDELKSAVERAKAGDSIAVNAGGDGIEVNEDLTIPEGVYLNIQTSTGSFTIAKDITFTTNAQFNCSASMIVEGVWQNNSTAYLNEMLQIASTGKVKNAGATYCWGGAFVDASGCIENNGYLLISNGYENNGTLTTAPAATTKVSISVTSSEELKAALSSNDHSVLRDIQWGVAENIVISEDITIPAGYTVNIYNNSDATLTIDSGVTFTNSAEIHCSVPTTVKGSWINNGNTNFSDLTIAEGGHIKNNNNLGIYGSYENYGTLTTAPSENTYLVAYIYDFEGLKTALASENPGYKMVNLYVTGTLVLTEDVFIPENTSLYVYAQNTDATLLVREGTTLTSIGYFACEIPMTVAGIWVNRYFGVNLQNGLTITSTGKVDNAEGWFQLLGVFVNNGVFTGNNFRQTTTATSLDELKTALNNTYTNNGTVLVTSDSDFTIAEDLMIPKGLTVEVYGNIQSLCIAAGTTLTIDSEATLRSYAPVSVDGTIVNYGALGIRNGMDVSGKIDNYNYIRVAGCKLTGEDKIIEHEASTCSVYQEYAVDSEEILHSTLDNLDLKKWNNLIVSDDLSLSKAVTIPEGVYLSIQAGTFTVGNESTLVTYNNLDVESNMIVDGHWENKAPVNENDYYLGCNIWGTLAVSGSVLNSGYLGLYRNTGGSSLARIQNTGSGSINYSVSISSLDELHAIVASADSPMAVNWYLYDDITLDQSLTLPGDMRLYIMGDQCSLTIPSDITLNCEKAPVVAFDGINVDVQGTLTVNGDCRAESINVSGQLKNAGSVSFGKLVVSETGFVENGGMLVGEIQNHGTITKMPRESGPRIFGISLMAPCSWEDIFGSLKSGDTLQIYSWMEDSYISISADTTFPDDIIVSGGGYYKVERGATFTTNSLPDDASIIVDGTWINNGSTNLWQLLGSGVVQNNGSINAQYLADSLTITGNHVSRDNGYTTLLELQDALSSAQNGDTIRCNLYNYGNGDSLVINENITVHEGVGLSFEYYTKVYLAEGNTLTVNGTLIVDQQMYFKGDFVLNGCIQVNKTDNRSHLVSDPFSLLNGLDKNTFTVWDTGDSWLIASKSDTNLFCEVQNTGCILRLFDGDNCLWTTVALSSGIVIPSVTAGQYTLEVSKPGYVTRRYTVDTSTMPETLSIELVETGNINGATNPLGYAVDASDMQCLYELLTTGDCLSQIDDPEYFKAVADVNGDGTVDVYDLQLLYEAVSGISKL